MAKKITRKQQAIAAKKRLLESAAWCFANLGVERSSVTEIAKRARCSRALVAHYFPVKDRLFEQVIEHILSEGYSQIDIIPAQLNKKDRVKRVIESNLRFFLSSPEYTQCILLLYYYASIDQKILELAHRIAERAAGRFEEITGRHDLSELLHQQVIGALFRYSTTKKTEMVDDYILRQSQLITQFL